MIIKSLELHNFRQFMDDEDGHGQKIIFSTDPDKKATLLIAKNAPHFYSLILFYFQEQNYILSFRFAFFDGLRIFRFQN